MMREIRHALAIAIGLTITAESFSVLGLGPSPHQELAALVTGPFGGFTLATLSFHFFVLRFFHRPSVAEGLAASAISGAFLLGCRLTGLAADAPLWYLAAVPAGALGLASLLSLLRLRALGVPEQEYPHGSLLGACALVVLMHANVEPYLTLTAALHPATFDGAAYVFDQTLGFQASAVLARLFQDWPALAAPATLGYFSIGYGFSALFGLQLAAPGKARFNIITFVILCWTSAYLLYHLCPVAGPAYVFHSDFPDNLPPIDEIRAPAFVIPPSARNAMPSMHFGWALGIFLGSLALSWPARILFGMLLALNTLATLGLGEHYLVDLIAAIPYVVAMYALCLRPGIAKPQSSRDAVKFGLGATLAWLLALRTGTDLFVSVPGLSWLVVIVTVAASFKYLRPLVSAPSAATTPGAPATRMSGPDPAGLPIGLLFFISGFAALVYQVLFSKALSYTFGSAATATYTVLATYMGGMALGAWLGGRIGQRRSDPVRVYAYCELFIALYCLATPFLFSAIQSLYFSIGAGYRPDDATLLVLRFLLGALALLGPTVLMGMTLPVLVGYFQTRESSLGAPVARLYTANTLGAAFGALIGGYAIIPALGVTNTIRIAAWMNILVAGTALILFNRSARGLGSSGSHSQSPPTRLGQERHRPRLAGVAAVLILGLSGVVTLGLEVAYMHLLAVVAGNSTYAFSLMLFVFLLGLAGGSDAARRLLRRGIQTDLILSLAQMGLALSLLGGVLLWERIPDYFASFEGYPLARSFAAREVVRGLVCFVAMFPSAFLIGAYYPACLQIVGEAFTGRRLEAAGAAMAVNTAGNIAGVLLIGFWVLPVLGALRSIQILALVSFGLGWLFFASIKGAGRRGVAAAGGAVVAAFLWQPGDFDYNKLATGANVYFRAIDFGRVIEHAESLDGGLTTVHRATVAGRIEPVTTLLTNGKFQGTDDRHGEMISQIGYGLVPLLHTASREAALVIGYGTGVTARVLHEAGFASLDLVDLSRDVFTLANRHFVNANLGVADRPGVEIFITDGRNFLALTDRQYDVITVQISSIWFAGAASLYNREFYHLVLNRLRPQGVFEQWVQLHHIRPIDLGYILGSVHAEFLYVWLYLVGEQGVIVATNDAAARPDAWKLGLLDRDQHLGPLLRSYFDTSARLLDAALLAPADIDRLVHDFQAFAKVPVSTDDNSVLEYSTPKGNVLDADASLKASLKWLQSYRQLPEHQDVAATPGRPPEHGVIGRSIPRRYPAPPVRQGTRDLPLHSQAVAAGGTP